MFEPEMKTHLLHDSPFYISAHILKCLQQLTQNFGHFWAAEKGCKYSTLTILLSYGVLLYVCLHMQQVYIYICC